MPVFPKERQSSLVVLRYLPPDSPALSPSLCSPRVGKRRDGGSGHSFEGFFEESFAQTIYVTTDRTDRKSELRKSLN